MNAKQLRERLYVYDQLEKEHYHKNDLEILKNMFYIKKHQVNEKEIFCFDMVSSDLIEINKQPRDTFIPLHIHTYMELCYVYDGVCTHRVNDQVIELTKGQLLLLDQNVQHQIEPLGATDIVINIMINKKYFNAEILKGICQKSTFIEFVLRSLSKQSHQENYLYFHFEEENQILTQLIEILLCEFYESCENSNSVIHSTLSLILQLLSRNEAIETNMREKIKNKKTLLSTEEIVNFIKENYQNCNLQMLEYHFGFNPHYISSYLKKHAGKSFKELLIEEKITHAKILLDETALPIIDIIEIVGFSNPTFFYKKFKQITGKSLSNYKRES